MKCNRLLGKQHEIGNIINENAGLMGDLAAIPCLIPVYRFALLQLNIPGNWSCLRNPENATVESKKQVTVYLGNDSTVPEVCFNLDPNSTTFGDILFGHPKDRTLLDRVKMSIKAG